MKITLFGCGGWGSRIARRLHDMGYRRVVLVDELEARCRPLAEELGFDWSSDPYGYLNVTGTQSSSVDGGAVIVATDPLEHSGLVRAILNGYGVPPRLLRVEKPLAMSVLDAATIALWCSDAGTRLTTGFTLLHHPLYEAAFEWLDEQGATATLVSGTRWGARPRHRCAALLDQGIHAASIAAHLDCPADIVAKFTDSVNVRTTVIETLAHGFVTVDEVEGEVRTRDGVLPVRDGDALTADLSSWLAEKHRGTPAVAIDAQRIIDRHIERLVVAA